MVNEGFNLVSGFAFIVSDIDYEQDDPFEIIHGYFFRRANSKEVKK